MAKGIHKSTYSMYTCSHINTNIVVITQSVTWEVHIYQNMLSTFFKQRFTYTFIYTLNFRLYFVQVILDVTECSH